MMEQGQMEKGLRKRIKDFLIEKVEAEDVETVEAKRMINNGKQC